MTSNFAVLSKAAVYTVGWGEAKRAREGKGRRKGGKIEMGGKKQEKWYN